MCIHRHDNIQAPSRRTAKENSKFTLVVSSGRDHRQTTKSCHATAYSVERRCSPTFTADTKLLNDSPFQPDSNDALRADSTSKDHQSVCEDSRADIIERSSDTLRLTLRSVVPLAKRIITQPQASETHNQHHATPNSAEQCCVDIKERARKHWSHPRLQNKTPVSCRTLCVNVVRCRQRNQ